MEMLKLEIPGKEKNVARDVYDKPIEFLMSLIAMSVGLGNVWRFPFTVYENGGGAFLIPYLIVLLLIGRPMFYLEMCLGQFSKFGQVEMWNMTPIFKGVGYASLLSLICAISYYCSILARVAFYLFASFAPTVPWAECDSDWGVDYCLQNGTTNPIHNQSAAELYYKLKAFPVKNSIEDGLGSPNLKLTLCLLFAWALIFFSLIKGVKTSGKVAYFTAIFPYVVLIVLLIRGMTLPGAMGGIWYFIKPDWGKMLEIKVWYAAVQQMFFSLSIGFGPIIMSASYNNFRHNIYRDAMIISFMDTFTSLLAGFTIFAVVGYLAQELNEDISNVANAGTGLAFVAYPAAIAKFPMAPIFAILFFLMLLTLGIGSSNSNTECVITAITDRFPYCSRWMVTLAVCILGFFAGLIYVTPGGDFIVQLVDYFGAGRVLYVVAMVEVAAVAWAYGLNKFSKDIEFMLGLKVGWYLKFSWGFFIPFALLGIFLYTVLTQEGFKGMPASAIVCGWVLMGTIVALLPIMAIHSVATAEGKNINEKIRFALSPTERWGPQDPELRDEWKAFRNRETHNRRTKGKWTGLISRLIE